MAKSELPIDFCKEQCAVHNAWPNLQCARLAAEFLRGFGVTYPEGVNGEIERYDKTADECAEEMQRFDDGDFGLSLYGLTVAERFFEGEEAFSERVKRVN